MAQRSVIEQLIVELGLDASGYREALGAAERVTDQSTKRMSVSLGGLGRAFGAVVGIASGMAAGFIAAAAKASEFARALDTATYRTGLGVEAWQEYTYAAQQTGVEVGLLTTTMQRLQRRAADANAGNEGLASSFRDLGVQLTDTNGQMLGTEELFSQVADGLAGVENNAERLRLAFAIFDTEGAKLLPLLSRGSEGIAELRDQARELGLVISGEAVLSLQEYRQVLDTVQRQFQTLTIEGVGALIPVLQQTLLPLLQNFLIPALQTVSSSALAATDGFKDLEDGQAPLVTFLQDTIVTLVTIGSTLIAVGRIATGAVTVLAAPFAALGDVIGQLSVGLPQFFDRYRRFVESGFTDWSAFSGRPIDALLPAGGFGAAMEAAARQAQSGVDIMGGGLTQLMDVFSGELNDRLRSAFAMGASTPIAPRVAGAGSAGGGTAVGGSGSGLTPALERTVQMVFEELADVGTQSLREATRLISVGADEEATRVDDLRTRIRQIENARSELLRDFYDDVTDAQLEYLVQRQKELEAELKELLDPTRASVPVPGVTLPATALPGALSAPVPLPFRDLPEGVVTSVVAAMDPVAIEAARASLAAFQATLEELGRAGREQSVFQRELAAAIADPFGTAERDTLRAQKARWDARTAEFRESEAAAASAAQQAQRDLNNYGLSLEELARRGRAASVEQREAAQAHDELTAALRRQKEALRTPAWDPFAGWSPPAVVGEGWGRDDGTRNAPVGTSAIQAWMRAQQDAADRFASTVVGAAFSFSDGLVDAIRSGDIGQAFRAVFSSASSIVGAGNFGALSILGGSVPLAGIFAGIIGLLGNIFGGLFGRREDMVQSRAAGAATRGAPSLELNLSVFQNIQTLSLAPGDRAQVDGFLNDTVDAVLGVIERTIIPRLDRLEERLA